MLTDTGTAELLTDAVTSSDCALALLTDTGTPSDLGEHVFVLLNDAGTSFSRLEEFVVAWLSDACTVEQLVDIAMSSGLEEDTAEFLTGAWSSPDFGECVLVLITDCRTASGLEELLAATETPFGLRV